MFAKITFWFQTYERHMSAAAMVAGFVFDNLLFNRIDVWETHAVFAGYALACFIAIVLRHWIEERATRGIAPPRLRFLLPLVTQFALGGFWSGFVIFYGRSAVLGVSWPFLIFLIAVFIGNEYFSRYHGRLVFTSVLYFFALYSYAIFAVPIYTQTIGTFTFLLSGVAAIGVFTVFTFALRAVGKGRFLEDVWRIRTGAFFVVCFMNVSYFTNILPPLPLSAEAAGIYHLVWREPGSYVALSETQPWTVKYLGFPPEFHVVWGSDVYAYTSIFAPTALSTTVVHEWQWYDNSIKKWVSRTRVSYPILGGRDGGYRGYSLAVVREEGKWRVSVETEDGRVISRLPFTVSFVYKKPEMITETLR